MFQLDFKRKMATALGVWFWGVKRQNNSVKDMLKLPDKVSEKPPDMFKRVYGDAHRADWNINGKVTCLRLSAGHA